MLLFSEVAPGKPKKNVVMGDHKFVDPLLVFPLLLSLLSLANHKRQLDSKAEQQRLLPETNKRKATTATIESCICSSHAIVNKYRTHCVQKSNEPWKFSQ